jgi:hypothetical protein
LSKSFFTSASTRLSRSAFSLEASGALRACVTTPMSICAWSGSAEIMASPLTVMDGVLGRLSRCCELAVVAKRRTTLATSRNFFIADPFVKRMLERLQQFAPSRQA